ncbi:hypothetical protein J2D73_06890 [Acetobacter sacchari]|uniref:Transposase n=1 Tax=Acetobacter sacchari TaxID=2661687 RepID=A0ABS3LUF0_9PROT|nr:hypothetical protein [Acetobacter sacchari]MBO1359523.1 hypothetical protein [Acetobacter sacchari]
MDACRDVASNFGAVMRRLDGRKIVDGHLFRRFRSHDLRQALAIRQFKAGVTFTGQTGI